MYYIKHSVQIQFVSSGPLLIFFPAFPVHPKLMLPLNLTRTAFQFVSSLTFLIISVASFKEKLILNYENEAFKIKQI